jgi:hypothetical protein
LLVRKSSCRRGGLFGTLFACFFLFFTLPNRILQIACQIVSITLGLVELALGLQLLVAPCQAASLIAPSLSVAPQRVRGPRTTHVCGLMYQQRAGASGRSIKRENAASGGTMCATKNLDCAAAEQQNQESRYC